MQAAVEYTQSRFAGPLSVVAASFGAVPTTLLLPWLGASLDRLVLWNPVLDLHHTFVEPELDWGKENFRPQQRRRLAERGVLLVDGELEFGQVLFTEFEHHRPLDQFLQASVPALIVHGDRDTAVSYRIAAETARARPATELVTIAGSDHGFDTEDRENEAITTTVGWLIEQPGS